MVGSFSCTCTATGPPCYLLESSFYEEETWVLYALKAENLKCSTSIQSNFSNIVKHFNSPIQQVSDLDRSFI